MLSAIYENRASLSEKVADEISAYIVDNNLEEGDQLPNEQVLSSSLNVGRSTIREAVKILVSRNVVEIKRGRGTYVTDMPGVNSDPLGLTFMKDRRKLVFDLLETRYIIEPPLAALAAERATKEEIMQMESLVKDIEILIQRQKNYAQKDVAFHALIVKSSKNRVMSALIPILNKSIWLFLEITKDNLLQETIETHRMILDAIKNGDGAAASEASKQHLRYNQVVLESKILNKKYDDFFEPSAPSSEDGTKT